MLGLAGVAVCRPNPLPYCAGARPCAALVRSSRNFTMP
jgi:hypothetical protein